VKFLTLQLLETMKIAPP